jgi:hypothetical protein
MRCEQLQIGMVAFALLASAGPALAQQSAPPPDPQQQRQMENWQHTPSGKHGKEEPSSHAPTSKPPSDAVLVDGALNVPGAPANTATVPAKFSERNAAADKLLTVAYALKSLTDEQRRAIYAALKDQAPGAAFTADVATQLPPTVDLRAVPSDLAVELPQIKDYRYAVTHDRVLLVSPPNRIVVGVFAEGSAPDAKPGGR